MAMRRDLTSCWNCLRWSAGLDDDEEEEVVVVVVVVVAEEDE